MKIHIATDHAGLNIKNALGEYLRGKGHDITDHGAYEFNSGDDYPDFIVPCAKAVAADKESRGIVLGGSGQGEAMAANRVKGVRAAVYYGGESDIPRLSRDHNNSNILSIGARFISTEEIYSVIDQWLIEPFAGGRHQRRIEKLDM